MRGDHTDLDTLRATVTEQIGYWDESHGALADLSPASSTPGRVWR